MTAPKNITVDYDSSSATMTVCFKAWPSINDLIAVMAVSPDIPPAMGTVQWPGLTAVYNAGRLISKAIKDFLMSIINPLIQAGLVTLSALDTAWQNFIGFACKIGDIISDNWTAIQTALAKAYADINLRAKIAWWFPTPLFSGVESFVVDVAHMIYELSTNFYLWAVGQITALIKSLPGIPNIPTLPTMAQIEAQILAFMQAEGATIQQAWEALKTTWGQKLSALQAMINAIPPIPNPLIPNTRVPSIEIKILKTNFMAQIGQAFLTWFQNNVINPLTTFLNNLGFGINFPPTGPWCIPIPIGGILTVATIAGLEKYGVSSSKFIK